MGKSDCKCNTTKQGNSAFHTFCLLHLKDQDINAALKLLTNNPSNIQKVPALAEIQTLIVQIEAGFCTCKSLVIPENGRVQHLFCLKHRRIEALVEKLMVIVDNPANIALVPGLANVKTNLEDVRFIPTT